MYTSPLTDTRNLQRWNEIFLDMKGLKEIFSLGDMQTIGLKCALQSNRNIVKMGK